MNLGLVATELAMAPAGGGNGPSDVNPATGKGPEWGKAAPIGLLVIVLMCVAVYFLVKSLNRNLKKVPESFQSSVPVPAGAVPAGAPTASTDAVQGGISQADSAASAGNADPASPGSAQ